MERVFLGSGQNGRCYLVGNRVLKEYKNEFIAKDMEKHIEELSKYNSDRFVFPDELYYQDNKFAGYYMKYINGIKTHHLDTSIKLEDYINEVINIEYAVASLSIQKIKLLDAGLNNTLYTKDNKIYFIDTDYYETNINSKMLYSSNLSKISYPLIYPYFDIYDQYFRIAYFNYYLELLKQGKILPSNFLYELKRYIEIYYNQELISINDLKKGLKLVLK